MLGHRMEALGVPAYALGMWTKLHSPLAVCRLWIIVHKVKSDIFQGWVYYGNIAAYVAGIMKKYSVWNIRHSIDDLGKEKILTRHIIQACARKSVGKMVSAPFIQ
jgi:hypothetical protein